MRNKRQISIFIVEHAPNVFYEFYSTNSIKWYNYIV